jgi:acetyltransferase-like isoleucine patch superfamily enzyme
VNGLWRTFVRPVTTDPVEIGPDAVIDDNVTLGYPTGRPVEDRLLRIGARAHLRSGTVIYGGSIIGDDLQTGHGVVIREENTIGDGLMIWSHSVIDYGCRIGSNVRIHTNVYLAQLTTVADDVFIAPGVTTANDLHPICTECMLGPSIGERARIGAGSTILGRVRIGEDAVVGAGSVVTRDVPPQGVVVGNPARMIGMVTDLKCRWGRKGWAYPDLREER